MAKQNNLQLYRGQGVPPTNSMLEGEIAMDTDKKVLWINNGQAIKPVGIIEGGTTPSADYAGTLWIDNSTSPIGISADFLVANNLTTQAPGSYVLDAYQGKILKDALDAQGAVISDQSDEISGLSDEISGLSDQIDNLSEDYIVEQGTSGIWTYRKWASGVAECWGETGNLTLTNYATVNNFYGYKTTVVYPSGLFISAPVTTWSASVGNAFALCGTIVLGTSHTSTSTDIYALSSISGSKTTNWYIRATGKWK